jgi:hypothetical protein
MRCEDRLRMIDLPTPPRRRPAVRRGPSARASYVGSPYPRPRLRLVHSRRPTSTGFLVHPALPSTIAFAALTVTALAMAAVVDVANAVAHGALAVGTQLRSPR